MKKMILVAALAAVLAPATLAGDKVYVEYNGSKEKMDVGDLKTTAVCALKSRIASQYDLKTKKFDLKKNGSKLNEDKTLYGANVRNHNKLQVITVSSSHQC